MRTIRIIASTAIFVIAFIPALFSFFTAWVLADLQTAFIVFAIVWGTMSIIGFIVLPKKNMGKILPFTPMAASQLYTISPVDIPSNIDDNAFFVLSCIATAILLYIRDRKIPYEIVIPIAVALAYTLIGNFIPGNLDEFMVNAATILYLFNQKNKEL